MAIYINYRKLIIWRGNSMTEKEKMLAGKIYDPSNTELTAMRKRT